MFFIFLLLFSCFSKNVEPNSSSLCATEYLILDALENQHCEQVGIVKDLEHEFIYYGVCEIRDEMQILSIALPTSIYKRIKNDVKKDGGRLVCNDGLMVVIDFS